MSLAPTPDERAGHALREVVDVVRFVFGDDVGRRAAAILSDPSRFLAAPSTVKAELEDLFQECRAQLEPTPENIKRLFKAGSAIERLNELARSAEDNSALTSAAGSQTLAFLQTSRFALDVETYRATIAEVDTIQISAVVHPSFAA
jgi:hypothetical protein